MKKPLKLTTYQLLIVRFCMNIYVCQKRVEFYAPTNLFIYIYVEQVKKNKFQRKQLFPYMLSKKTMKTSAPWTIFCLQTRIFPCVSRFPSFKIDNKNISWNPRLGAQKKSESLGAAVVKNSGLFFGGGNATSPRQKGGTPGKKNYRKLFVYIINCLHAYMV